MLESGRIQGANSSNNFKKLKVKLVETKNLLILRRKVETRPHLKKQGEFRKAIRVETKIKLKKMKKVLSMIGAMLFASSLLISCGEKSAEETTTPAEGATTTTEQPAVTTPEPAPAPAPAATPADSTATAQ
jgi:hypothetical protein